VFGILKGRWRFLKSGTRVAGSYVADSIWMTCCALHNRLLVLDGLDGEWEGALGRNELDDFRSLVPFAVQRMENPEILAFGSREHEREAQLNDNLRGRVREHSSDTESKEDGQGTVTTNTEGAIAVNSLSYFEFRRRLIVHFDILHRQHKIRWPKRNQNEQ